MTIIRSPRPDEKWTVFHNETLRDTRLSFRARGILAFILSQPDNWDTTSEQLARQGKEGREAIRSAMRELIAFGYMRIIKKRNDKGQFVTTIMVYDRPTEARETEAQKTDVGFLGLNIKTIKKDYKEVELPPIVPHDSFDEFWTIYPRKEGKTPARRAWDKAVKKTSADEILQGARRYESDPNREPIFTAHAATWLNQERWTDEALPSRSVKVSATRMFLEVADNPWHTKPELEAQ